MPPFRVLCHVAVFCALAGPRAATAQTAPGPDASPVAASPVAAAPVAAADAAYQAHDYARSGPLYLAAAARGDDPPNAYYNAACSFALAGNAEAAFAALGRAVAAGYTDVAHAQADADLASLRADARWARLLDGVTARVRADRAFWTGPAMRTPYRENLSDDEKVAGLSKLWAEAKFNFVYFDHVPRLDWDALYLETLPRVRATRSTLEYYRVLTAVYAQLHDGHTGVWMPDALDDSVYARPLLRTARVDGRVLVVAAADSLRAGGLVPGVEIVAIDGVPAAAYAEQRVAPYLGASTPQDREARVYGGALLQGARGTPVVLTTRDVAGRVAERRVPRVPAAEYARAFAREPMTFRMLPGGVAYVALNSFGDDRAADRFEAAFPEIARATALVLDVRENGGGNSGVGYRVLATLADRAFATSTWVTRDYRPAFRAWGRSEGRYASTADSVRPSATRHFAHGVVVLTSPRTFSAAEDFAMTFRGMRRGRIVGEATAGSTGQPLAFPLPGGGGARVCTKHDVAADGTEFVGVGITPDVVAPPTARDLRTGRDAALEAAVATLRSRQ